MSKNNLKNVKEIVNGLFLFYGAENAYQLSKKLGYKSNVVAKWLERDSIPVKNLSKKCPELNPKFLQGQDAPIESKHYIKNNLQTDEGHAVFEKIKKYLASDTELASDNQTQKILLAFRDQLKSQRSETDSMIQILNILIDD